MRLSELDLVICLVYCVSIVSLALWVSRSKGEQKSSQDYFLAGRSLPWWAIGASLIAANISAEQIIGMSGSGYAIGIAIASYEWMAALTLIIVGKYFVPIYLKTGIYTMPQFLEIRFDKRVKTTLAVFWLFVYVFVNLTSIVYLGAMAMDSLTGVGLSNGLLFLAFIAAAYSLYGGLKAIAITDIVQVVLLVFGGLCVTYIALNTIGGEAGVWGGFSALVEKAPEKFDMILSPDNPHYISLPGLSVVIGGMWIMNLSYWGFNQYITQRTLAAKNVNEARKGILFAAFLKILMPIIVVLPGVAAVILMPDLKKPDEAYPAMMSLLPNGILGLTFAALIAAIVSSIGSMINSIATIFSMDIYKELYPEKNEKNLVTVGRIAAMVSLVIAVFVARPLLGNLDQAYQYIQEVTGFVTPGIVCLFLFGMFWKKSTADGAFAAAITSVVASILLWLYFPNLPFIDRVGLVFLFCCFAMVAISNAKIKRFGEIAYDGSLNLSQISFGSTLSYNILSVVILFILSAFYFIWW